MWHLHQLHWDPPPIFQQDSAPPNWRHETRALLNERLPGRLIGRASERDTFLLHLPPRSTDITPLEMFLWGYLKDIVVFFFFTSACFSWWHKHQNSESSCRHITRTSKKGPCLFQKETSAVDQKKRKSHQNLYNWGILYKKRTIFLKWKHEILKKTFQSFIDLFWTHLAQWTFSFKLNV